MPAAHPLPINHAHHGFMAAIAIGAEKQPILFEHLHQRPLAPGDGLSRPAFIFTHEVVGRRRHEVGAGTVEAAKQHVTGRAVRRCPFDSSGD